MLYEDLFNIYRGFDFNVLNDTEFKEDSVREELVVPLIKGLGYSATKPNQIVRSRRLLHPYVSIGSQRKEVYIVPDYLFLVDDKPARLLDAKAPTEPIVNSVHVEQAYSYAIHSEVRVKHFALCNGSEFVLYNIDHIKPVLHFPMRAIPLYWDAIRKLLSPENVLTSNPFKMSKDLGLHLKRLGFDACEKLVFTGVPLTHIGQMDNDNFSTSGGIKVDGESYVVSFDFGANAMRQLVGKIPNEAMDKLMKRSINGRTVVQFADRVYYVNIECRIGEKLEENENEIFLPLRATGFVD